jgi:hypothetical protein
MPVKVKRIYARVEMADGEIHELDLTDPLLVTVDLGGPPPEAVIPGIANSGSLDGKFSLVANWGYSTRLQYTIDRETDPESGGQADGRQEG